MNDCAEVRTSLGVYVLGAIEPAERGQVDAHLASCPACRDELAGLAGLPALLGRVEEAQLQQLAGPPPEMLESLLARAVERRGRRLRGIPWAPLAAAACVLLVVGALFGGLLTSANERGAAAPPVVTTSPAPASPSRPIEPKTERINADNPRTGVKGHVILTKRKSGTGVELYLSGAPYGKSCRFSVVARNGQKDVLGSWYVAYRGKGYGEYSGFTRFQRDELYSLEINTLDGRPLLNIPA